MNFLEVIGLLTILFASIVGVNKLLEKIKEDERKSEENRKEGEMLLAEFNNMMDAREAAKVAKELKEMEIVEKQDLFFKKWKDIDMEEEYLIRIGKKASPLFDPGLFMGYFNISPWRGTAKEEVRQLSNPSKEYLLIKGEDIIEKFGIPEKTLDLLYRGYINEYYNDQRKFTEKELNMENFGSINLFAFTAHEKAKSNLHQITFNRIVQTLEELQKIAERKNEKPIYQIYHYEP